MPGRKDKKKEERGKKSPRGRESGGGGGGGGGNLASMLGLGGAGKPTYLHKELCKS